MSVRVRAHAAQQRRGQRIYVGDDGHVHFVDPDAEAFHDAVWAFALRMGVDELPEGWEAIDVE